MKKIVMIVGARPNFMKAFPVYLSLKNDFDLTLIHTGQHFDAKMSDIFFNQLGFPKPDIHFDLESKTRAGEIDDKLYVNNDEYLQDKKKVIEELKTMSNIGQLGEIRDKLMIEFNKIKPNMVIVFGDVTSTLAGALASLNLNIEISHIESGLRSFDLKMPEEVNRILTDTISNYLFVTEQSGIDNLKKEGKTDNVYLVGNTMIDCLMMFKDKAMETKYYEKLECNKNEYVLITLHRPSNVDDIVKLKEIVDDIILLSETEKIIFPIHPRTKKNIENLGYVFNENVIICEPLGYLEFSCLEANAKYVITDSGGIQEETTAFGTPCFTLRENTERPSTLVKNGGTNVLCNKIILFNTINNTYENKNINNNGKSSINIKHVLNNLINYKFNNIMITIDVEALRIRAENNHFDKLIFGKYNNDEYGINKFIELGNKYGIRMLFFVNYMNYFLDKIKFIQLINIIKNSGHELGIHLHPEDGLVDLNLFINKKPELKFIDDTNSDILINIIQKINKECNINPKSYRGGGFEINKIFFEKLCDIGITFFYNCNFIYNKLTKHFVTSINDTNMPIFNWYNNTYEFNTTQMISKKSNYGFLNINEIDDLLIKSDQENNKYNYSNIIIVLHSWYFLDRNYEGYYDKINIDKYKMLENILFSIKDKFSFLLINEMNLNLIEKLMCKKKINIEHDIYNNKYQINEIKNIFSKYEIVLNNIQNISYGVFYMNKYNLFLYDSNNKCIASLSYNFKINDFVISYK